MAWFRFPIISCSILVTLITVSSSLSQAQSTSHWIPVQYFDGATIRDTLDGEQLSVGHSYISIKLEHTRIYHNANWWTRLIGGGAKAVVGLSINGTASSAAISDTRVSPPYEIKDNDANVDMGWSQGLVTDLPAVFSNLSIRVHVSKSEGDRFNTLIQQASELSQTAPTVSLSQAALGFLSAGKMIGDLLFKPKLLEKKIESTGSFAATERPREGCYVVFAGDDFNSYKKYLSFGKGDDGEEDVAAVESLPLNARGKKNLVWKLGTLVVVEDDREEPVSDVSYFVLRVDISDSVFGDESSTPLERAYSALNSKEAWASLFREAYLKAQTFNVPGEQQDVQDVFREVWALLTDGRSILDADLDIVFDEKKNLFQAMQQDLETIINERAQKLGMVDGTTTPGFPEQSLKARDGFWPAGAPALQYRSVFVAPIS